MLEHRFEHAFERSPSKVGKGPTKWTEKCELCGGKPDETHHAGFPPSVNDFLNSPGARFRYRYVKKIWGELFLELVTNSGLGPSKLIQAEGRIITPDHIARDQGNFRFFIEKCLGDALEKAGVLANDSWDFYTFGNLDYVYRKDVRGLELMLMPLVDLDDYAAATTSTNGVGT